MEHRQQHQHEQHEQHATPTITSAFWLHYQPDFHPEVDPLQTQPNPWLRLQRLDEALTPIGCAWLQQRGNEFGTYEFRPLINKQSGTMDPLHEADKVIHFVVGPHGQILDAWASPLLLDDTVHPGIDVAFDVEFDRLCGRVFELGASHIMSFHVNGEPDKILTRDLKEFFQSLPQVDDEQVDDEMEHRQQHQVEQHEQHASPTIASAFWIHYYPDFHPDIDLNWQELPNPWLRLQRLDEALTPIGSAWLQQRSNEFPPYDFRPLIDGRSGTLDPLHEADKVILFVVGPHGQILEAWAAPLCVDDVAFNVVFQGLCHRVFNHQGASHIMSFHVNGEPDKIRTRDLKEHFQPLPQIVEERDMLILGPTPSLATKEERIVALEVGHRLEWSDADAGTWFIASREHVHTLDHQTLQWRIYSEPQEATAFTVDPQRGKQVPLATKAERIAAFDAGHQLQWANEIGLRSWFVATREHVQTLDHSTLQWRIQPQSQELTAEASGTSFRAQSDPGFYGRMASRLSSRNDSLTKALDALIAGCEEIAHKTGDDQVSEQLQRLVRAGRQAQVRTNRISTEVSDA